MASAASSSSSRATLFTSPDGEPLLFYVPPDPQKRYLVNLIVVQTLFTLARDQSKANTTLTTFGRGFDLISCDLILGLGLVCVGVIFVGLQKHGGEVLSSVADADEDEEVIELVPAIKINYVDRRLADKVFSTLFVTNSIRDRRLHVQQHTQHTCIMGPSF